MLKDRKLWMKNNRTLLNQIPTNVLGIGIYVTLMVLLILGFLGSVLYIKMGMLHPWSISTFLTLAVLIVTFPVAFLTEYAFEEKKIRNKFTKTFGALYWVISLVLTAITLSITLWCVHWTLGFVFTLAALTSVVGAVIVYLKSGEV